MSAIRPRFPLSRATCRIAAMVMLVGSGCALAPARVFAESATTARYAAVGPVRLADTREADCGCERLDAHTVRVVLAGRAGVPSGLVAAAITVTATAAPTAGYVAVYPAGHAVPQTSTLNVVVGSDTANSTIIPVGDGGAIDVFSSVATDLIVDITGAFTPAATARAGRFVPVVPSRLVDTRVSLQGGLGRGGSIVVPLPAGVSPDASAVVVNVTSVGARSPGYLVGFAAGATPPPTSFLNPDGSGAPRAASVILPVSSLGLTITSSVGGDVVVDLAGFFTGPSAADSQDGLFVPLDPTRLLDTRTDSPRLWPAGTREVTAPLNGIAALVSNITVVEADAAGFVTAYPAGTALPATSSLNAARRDDTVANMAVTPLSSRGVAYFSSRGSDLLVDATGAFTGGPVAATLAVPSDVAPVPRVLMIGDSTLGGLIDVPAAQTALRGFVPLLDAKPCRRLIHPSCTSRFTLIAPNTAVEAIRAAAGPIDIAVIKAGYNDSSSDFETAVAQVVHEARAQGARVVIWLTYSESTRPGSYDAANAVLHRLAGSPAYPDLVVADWRGYASTSSNWYGTDRVHLLTTGVWATADYISRWVAHVSRLACPVPWTLGVAAELRCPSPDQFHSSTGTFPDLRRLYGF